MTDFSGIFEIAVRLIGTTIVTANVAFTAGSSQQGKALYIIWFQRKNVISMLTLLTKPSRIKRFKLRACHNFLISISICVCRLVKSCHIAI